MSDHLPSFARQVLSLGAVALSFAGWFLWMFGAVLTLAVGCSLLFGGLRDPIAELGYGAYLLGAGAIVLQAVGSAMFFFSQALADAKPLEVPTEWLPIWWLSRFMRPLLVAFGAVFACGLVKTARGLDPLAILYALGLILVVRGFRHFHHRVQELTPPYPPSGIPRPIRRGTSPDPADQEDDDAA
ncbi:MAG: hypothetical protein QM755_05765 [Luteolibacter sp.]